MSPHTQTLRELWNDDDGAAIVEFALVVPTLMILVIGLFELSHGMYVQAVLDGAMEEAGRSSSLETADETDIELFVEGRVYDVAPQATVATIWRAHKSYSDVGQLEDFSDINGDGRCNVGEPYADANASDNLDHKGNGGIGNPNEAVVFTAIAEFDRVFPMPTLAGWSATNMVTSTTILRNQPYRQHDGKQEIKPCDAADEATTAAADGAPIPAPDGSPGPTDPCEKLGLPSLECLADTLDDKKEKDCKKKGKKKCKKAKKDKHDDDDDD